MSKNEMIMLPREVVDQAMKAMSLCRPHMYDHASNTQDCAFDLLCDAVNALRTALDQPQPDPAPYLYYDPENGDTWTPEAIDDGLRQPDGLIALYTK